MDSYKSRIAELESSLSEERKSSEGKGWELERVKEKLERVEEEREKEREESALVEERVKELEGGDVSRRSRGTVNGQDDGVDEEEEGGDLEDAMSGTTMTSLKLQIRQLKRDLAAARSTSSKSTDGNRVLVLENLLEDATRMKRKYEGDYLKECREKLVAQGKLEQIMSGKSKLGDGCDHHPALCRTYGLTSRRVGQKLRSRSGNA